MTRPRILLAALVALLLAAPAATAGTADKFNAAVAAILAEPYQAAYEPTGNDKAFPGNVPNTAPSQDYTSGSVPGNPDHPGWPAWFKATWLTSLDGAPLSARIAIHDDGTRRPGIVVVHGFNTRGKESVIRWAAMLYANGYNVIAANQRSFRAEYDSDNSYPTKWPQTFGWKEAEDVVAAGRFLEAQPGVRGVGVMGFSLGGQDTVLALAIDAKSKQRVFRAALNFSGPASQNSQIWSTKAECPTPTTCQYPATYALVILVVPPYNTGNPCTVLDRAAAVYKPKTPWQILAEENAFRRQQSAKAPLLNLYAQDDPLVLPFHATMMAGYEQGRALQRTLVLEKGAHAYFYDRWWQQRAILLYFKSLLPWAPKNKRLTTEPTVDRTEGGTPASSQLVDLGNPTKESADMHLAPYVCDTTQPPPVD